MIVNQRGLFLRWVLPIAVVVMTAVVLVVVPTNDPEPVARPSGAGMTGNATHFHGLDEPFGGCGLPQHVLDSQDFVSLNVFDAPGDYASYPRPVSSYDDVKVGRWENGRNCGRFVEVTIGDHCTGINDGATGQPFCRDGSWVSDKYNGSTLTMVVADSCAEATAWCRDDRDHLGLSTSSLRRFLKNGALMSDLNSGGWNNRQVSWSFVPAPDYQGDLRIGFLQGSQRYWPVIAVSHLANGIHGAEYLSADGTWQSAQPNGDLGQSFVVGPTASGGAEYQIRVRDAADELVNDGRVYRFALPAECAPTCTDAYTKVDYSTDAQAPGTSSSGATTTEPTTTSTTAPDTRAVVAPTQGPPTQGPPTQQPPAPQPPIQAPPVQPSPTRPAPSPTTPPQQPSIACAVTTSVVNSWSGGYELSITVRNTGTNALSGWRTSFSFAGSQRIGDVWNAVATQSGRQVTGDNAHYNGTVAPGATAGWGTIVTGAQQPLSGLRCIGR